MGHKEELEKFKELEEKRKKEIIDKYGFDIYSESIENHTKGVEKFVKCINRFGKTTKIFICIIVIIIICLFIGGVMFVKSESNADVYSLQKLYNIKMKLISKEIDNYENGNYWFCLKDNPEIQFQVIKKFGRLRDDFQANNLKFYFEKWNDLDKENFSVVEEWYDDGMLKYEIYIEPKNYEDLDNVIDILYNFERYCGEHFYFDWSIYIKCSENFINFHSFYPSTEKENREYIKRIYLDFMSGKSIEDINFEVDL